MKKFVPLPPPETLSEEDSPMARRVRSQEAKAKRLSKPKQPKKQPSSLRSTKKDKVAFAAATRLTDFCWPSDDETSRNVAGPSESMRTPEPEVVVEVGEPPPSAIPGKANMAARPSTQATVTIPRRVTRAPLVRPAFLWKIRRHREMGGQDGEVSDFCTASMSGESVEISLLDSEEEREAGSFVPKVV